MMSLRTEIEKKIYELADDMDPSGKNTERYKEFFLQFKTDKEFYKFIDEFFDNPDKNFPISYDIFTGAVSLEFAHDVAKKRGIPVYERVFRPYLNGDLEDPPATIEPMMVLDIPVKRLKQMVLTKNHATVSASKKDPRTGQVTGADRTARVTDVEAYSMLVQGQYAAAKEYYGPLSDDTRANAAMMRAIQRDGEVELADLPNDPLDKVTMNTINAFMLGSGLETNFITGNGYVLPITLRGKDEEISTIKRD